MVSLSEVPVATVGFMPIYFSHLDGGNVLVALVYLALARRASQTDLGWVGAGVLGVDVVELGNIGRAHVERSANEWRKIRAALIKLYTLEHKAFRRMFKMNRV